MEKISDRTISKVTSKKQRIFNSKENKIIQFGGGNFLRAFVDFYFNKLNDNNLLNSGVTLIKATPHESSFINRLKEQDFNYTLIERGVRDGEIINESSIIDIITDVVNPYDDFSSYLECAKNENLRFVVSNTTEAGIIYDSSAKFNDAPQQSFPGKIARLLFERFEHFKGDKSKGLVFLPCELIENNGTALREIVLKHANDWNLTEEFCIWVKEANYFTNTLVDRIVPGFPKDEIEALHKKFGYIDNCVVTAEIFNFWVIEGPTWLKEELPFHKLGLNVVWTENSKPFKSRKVRILNGGHTSTVLGAYLAGFRTVGEMMENEKFNKLLNKILFEEVIPTLDLPKDDLANFANSVFDRFKNPFIKHYLYDISLNSISKFKARVSPTIADYYNTNKEIPKALTFSFACLISFYRGLDEKGEKIELRDDKEVVDYFNKLWSDFDSKEISLEQLVSTVTSNVEYFGYDFNSFDNFTTSVVNHIKEILAGNILIEIDKLI